MVSSREGCPVLSPKARALRGAATGLAGGLFSGLTGVGGGAVMVPMLVGLLRLSQHRAHGTSLAVIIFVASAAVVPYGLAGNIDWPLAGLLSVGAALGVYPGARVMQRIPARQLRLLFGLFLFATSIRLLVG
jgi:uncharacterized membrane protein YfcA